MNLTQLKTQIPDYGRDIRLNLETVLSEDGAPGVSLLQLWSTALACAYALDSSDLVESILQDPETVHLDDSYKNAARSAAIIMALNNVYYRSVHLLHDEGVGQLPARLRMNVIGSPGIPKVDFEAMCFAISALSGCEQCLKAHKNELKKAGVEDLGVQSLIRIASVMQAADSALRISRM